MMHIIAAIIRLVTLFLTEKASRDKIRKTEKKELRKDLTAAIKTRDPSEITKAFDRARRA